ncbi:DNA adenine methylase [Mammaliicoccus sciuri]|uniref:DNA adenine methylase n=1 Tax=Mammaliicoccus sciuri TaxID=1296 RepID=UPI002DB6A05D|nr:DNA adenine methylase [Mammaliicoccus sciuri]MEB7404989.1 DNA adenine methylase [Mammaliicoccus sciuri]MEB8312765.1 DNA adenine methylase [Mammaliicoccus sciuri]
MYVDSPLRYPGGKTKTYKYIKYLIELNNCNHYIEPYAGGAGVAIKLLLNKDVNKITLNDYDISIYSFWYSVINYTDELIQLIYDTPIDIENWYKQKEIQSNKYSSNISLLEIGFSTLFLNRTNRSGIIKAGVIGGIHQNGNYKLDCRFKKDEIIKKIEEIAKFKNKIKLSNKDAIDFINQNISHTKDSLTFFDPPYFEKGPGLYTNFYTKEDHTLLSKTIYKSMQNKYWILTYDIAKEIEDLYSKYDHKQYFLNYSLSKPYKGKEFIFFSPLLNPGITEKYLRLVY